MNVWVTQALGHNTLNQVLMCLECAAKFEFLIFDTDYAAVDGNTKLVMLLLLAVPPTAFTANVYFVAGMTMLVMSSHVLHTRYAATSPTTSLNLATTSPLTPPSSSWKVSIALTAQIL